MNLSAFLTFCYLCSPDPCEIEELPLSWMMDWELDSGAGCHLLSHMCQLPLAPLCSPDPSLTHPCLIPTRAIELFLLLLVWNESVQGQMLWSREGGGVGIWQPAAGWDCHGATDQAWWLCQGHTSFCQQETETSLCYTGCWPQSVKCSNWQEVALDLFYLNLLFVCKYWWMNS